MATIAEFTVPAEQFPLGSIFTDHPDVTVELERMIPTNHAIIPYFWVHGAHHDDVEDEFSAHPGVVDISLVDSVNKEYLLRVEWDADYHGVLSVLAKAQTALISVVGTNTEWTVEVRGDERQDVAALMDTFREADIPVTLTSIHSLNPVTLTDYGLTDAQREALTLAQERGYFKSPRQVKLEVIAEEQGVSRQAFADRLRRGLDNLVETTLVAPSNNT